MPDYICTECEETFFDRSEEMPLLSPCPNCGEEETVSRYTEFPEIPEPPTKSVDPIEEARAAAGILLAEQGISEPPVDVEAIAKALGLEVTYVFLGDVDGELREGKIRINADHHVHRQRFSIAHELGHFTLHGAAIERNQEMERQANSFAAALLIPQPLLRQAVAETTDFEVLRRRFAVSRDALKIALEKARLSKRVDIPDF
jgi:predicted  nucleic acid-binding Zn-ribbon protein